MFKKLSKPVVIIAPLLAILSIGTGFFYFYQKNKVEPRKSLSNDYVVIEPDAPSAGGYSVSDSPYTQSSILKSLPTGSLSIETNEIKVFDTSGKQRAQLSEGKIIGAEFATNDVIYYQVSAPKNEGVYTYDLNKKQKDLVIATSDSKTFRNITFIDKENYFFIQENTGKIGFGKVGSSESRIIDEKLLSIKTNYAVSSAYKFASVSPDKKFIAVYDLSEGNEKAKLKIFPVNAKTAKDIYLEVAVPFLAKPLNQNDKIFNWSSDSKFIMVGDTATTIEIASKKTIFNLSSLARLITISPNNDKISYCVSQNQECFIETIATKEKVLFGKDVKQALWMSNQDLILVIGERLYSFNTKENKLYSLSPDKKPFELIETNPIEETAWVRINDKIIQIQNSSKDKQI